MFISLSLLHISLWFLLCVEGITPSLSPLFNVMVVQVVCEFACQHDPKRLEHCYRLYQDIYC